jgi:membrane protease YdiL (CAAX protease family)
MRILSSIGRFILFVIAAEVLQSALQALVIFGLHYKPPQGWTWSDLMLAEGVSVIALFAVTWAASKLERRPLADYGLPLRRAFGKRWWEGMLWGSLAPAAAMALIIAAGAASIDGLALHGSTLLTTALLWLGVMVLLGIFEELLFRGYPQAALARGIGFWPAALVISFLFGAIHYFTKPMENWVDATTVGLLGLFLCFTLKRTGDLWFAIGFHTGFDYVALNVLGAPNTGNGGKPLDDHFLASHFTGADWLTGGPRGIEASALMFVVIAALFFFFDRRFRARPSATPLPSQSATPVSPLASPE